MRWKITGQFLVAILITIVISLVSFVIINIFLFYKGPNTSTDKFLSVKAPSITLDYSNNIEYRDGKIFISEDKLKLLNEYKSWIQVLDENGEEMYSRFKPEHVPSHYTVGELIFYYKYSGAIKGYTIFGGILNRDGKKLSYIMGYPDNMVARASLMYNPNNVASDMLKLLFGTIIAVMIIAVIIGYLFSSRFAEPLVRIIGGIKLLSKGDYSKKYEVKGLYRDVYQSLNSLTQNLQSNEVERKRIEKMREEWIANISHDLKTPLASIRGYSEVLLDPDYDLSSSEIENYAQIILNKANYMGSLIEDLKLTYQLKNATVPLGKKEENLVEILRESIIGILNHPKYENKDIVFETNKERVNFSCDKLLIQRAVTNLLYNAVVHNPEDTRIIVRIEENREIKIEIEDNGRGIKEEDLKNLFERYYRGTNTGESHKGSGLGMAIAKQIIEAHGGKIEVESAINKGTKVIIKLKG